MTRLRTAALTAVAVAALAGCGSNDDPTLAGTGNQDALSAKIMTAEGEEAGTVEVAFSRDGTVLTVQATGLEPGLHGMHVHKTGKCEPDSADPTKPDKRGAFLSAGGHVADTGESHGDHDGDLPSLLVRSDGSARLVVASDRLTRESVLDADGSALMVHADRDNFGNVPDRYTPTLDETTTKTGDAGARIACAVLTG